jgi:protocatechuate 3,4-dioxygenase beta subunit
MKVLRLLTVLIFVSRLLQAQLPEPDAQPSAPSESATQSTPLAQPPATGSVIGHVYLGDSHLPARMAYVILLPVDATGADDKKSAASTATVQTGLDGTYVMQNILPGTYYIAAAKLGYASPVPASYLISDDAPKEMKEALAATLTPVVVVANRIGTTDIVLNKGAVIAGTVRFDDGEPDSQATVSLLRKDNSGKWTEYATWDSLFSAGQRTDDQGNFRLTGLPPGEYLLRTTLELGGADVNSPGTDTPHEHDYRWDIYLGDGVRPRDAKTIQLKDGEESNGNNIEIRLARLHSVSGTVLSLETGAPINRADVELHNADDDSTCTVTKINPATGQFHFPYVAEGEYTLKVTNAADILPGKGDQKPIRTYADASQPLIVKSETNGIAIQVKPQPMAAAAQ